MTRSVAPASIEAAAPPGWAVTAAAEALGFDRHEAIHSAADWEAITRKAWELLGSRQTGA